jgi:hypothetical protein
LDRSISWTPSRIELIFAFIPFLLKVIEAGDAHDGHAISGSLGSASRILTGSAAGPD